MNCPKCDGRLELIVVDEIEVDRCDRCEGIWFDQAELGTLLDSREELVRPLLGGSDRDGRDHLQGRCPREGADLMRVLSARNHEVVLDVCPRCKGIWLDGGEFRRIKQAQPGIRLGELV